MVCALFNNIEVSPLPLQVTVFHIVLGLGNVLRKFKPEIQWDENLFHNRDKRSAQRELYTVVSKIFSSEEVIEDYFHEELTRISGATVQFDIFVPQRNLALEYHGIHHYHELPPFGSLDLYRTRDREKEKLCETNNITLIQVPFDWQQMHSSLHEFVTNKLTNK